MSLADEMAKDAGAQAAPTNRELEELNSLANRQLELERQKADLELKLKELGEELGEVQEILIPNLMSGIGMKEFRLTNGFRVTIKDDIYASMRADKITDCVAWLDSKGLGDIVKDEVKVNFGRGEKESAALLMEHCQRMGFNASEKLSVHFQTLKATVKEQLEQGVEFPDDLFSIAPKSKAVIKLK